MGIGPSPFDRVGVRRVAHGGLEPAHPAGGAASRGRARRAVRGGERTLVFHGSKIGGRARSARLMAPVRADLAEWRMASGRPPDGALVFPRQDGSRWKETDYRNWRVRVFKPSVRAVGVTGEAVLTTCATPPPRSAPREVQRGRSRAVARTQA